MSFTDLGLSPEILKAVAESGYTVPTPIQVQAIPYVLMGRDVLGCAQTGTGKTASFTLPMIDILASGRARARMARSLILEPTRELAAQVAASFERYGKHSRLNMALLTGGTSLAEQERRLDRGVDVLIATPGRLLDLIERGKVLLADVKILVIDETDRMLDMGFIPDVERIVGLLPKIRQTLFFSATMPPEIRRLADAFLINPKEVTVSPPTTAAETVSQALLKVGGAAQDKRAALRGLLRREGVSSALIFCNRKRDVDVLYKSLRKHGHSVAALHGDMAQPVRTATLERFKAGEVQLLVCSDVAARGLDIPAVSHVFNFDVPVHAEDYIHRIGRTGRAGRSGQAFTLALPAEARALAGVSAMLGRPIPETTLDGVEGWSGAERAGPRRGRQRRPESRRPESRRPESRRPESRRPEAKRPEPKRGETKAGQTTPDETTPRETKSRETTPRETTPRETKPRETKRREAKPREARPARARRTAGEPSHPSKPFGEHTPAFMLRPVKVA